MEYNESVRVAMPLPDGMVAYVSMEDAPRLSLFKWRSKPATHTTYVQNENDEFLHRVVLDACGIVQVDHIDCNGLNNCRSNLRLATSTQNHANQRKRSGLTSRHKGVTWNKRNQRWAAQITREGEHFSLGFYDDENVAGQAYNAIARILFGEFARLNDIDENPLFDSAWATNVLNHRHGFATTPYKGVTRCGERWRSQAYPKGTGAKISLGTFDTAEKASAAYQAWKDNYKPANC